MHESYMGMAKGARPETKEEMVWVVVYLALIEGGIHENCYVHDGPPSASYAVLPTPWHGGGAIAALDVQPLRRETS